MKREKGKMPAIGIYEAIIIGALLCGLFALLGLAAFYLLRRDKN